MCQSLLPMSKEIQNKVRALCPSQKKTFVSLCLDALKNRLTHNYVFSLFLALVFSASCVVQNPCY